MPSFETLADIFDRLSVPDLPKGSLKVLSLKYWLNRLSVFDLPKGSSNTFKTCKISDSISKEGTCF